MSISRSISTWVATACLALLAGCSSTGGLFSDDDGLDPEDVPAAIEEANAALANDDAREAIDILIPASRSVGLAPELRDRVQIDLERAAQLRIQQLSTPDADVDEMAELIELGLPRQIAVQAGLAAARRYVELDEPYDAYELLKRLDDKFPVHHERVASGDLMADMGLSLKDDTPTIFGWFDTLDESQEILEYVILKTPWARRCDEAYWALSILYANDEDWPLAIARAEGLLLSYPASPLAIAAQARVPELRLLEIQSPEYDRQALEKARKELQEWLVSHSGNSLEPKVRLDLADCLVRLCESDLQISKFYRTVDNPLGAQRHARRAIEEARDSGDDEYLRKAEEWQSRLAPASNPITGTEVLP